MIPNLNLFLTLDDTSSVHSQSMSFTLRALPDQSSQTYKSSIQSQSTSNPFNQSFSTSPPTNQSKIIIKTSSPSNDKNNDLPPFSPKSPSFHASKNLKNFTREELSAMKKVNRDSDTESSISRPDFKDGRKDFYHTVYGVNESEEDKSEAGSTKLSLNDHKNKPEPDGQTSSEQNSSYLKYAPLEKKITKPKHIKINKTSTQQTAPPTHNNYLQHNSPSSNITTYRQQQHYSTQQSLSPKQQTFFSQKQHKQLSSLQQYNNQHLKDQPPLSHQNQPQQNQPQQHQPLQIQQLQHQHRLLSQSLSTQQLPSSANSSPSTSFLSSYMEMSDKKKDILEFKKRLKSLFIDFY